MKALIRYESGRDVDLTPLRARLPSRIEPLPEFTGWCVMFPDDRERYKRGATFSFHDGYHTITGTVTRRRAQRDGSVKLWLSGVGTETHA